MGRGEEALETATRELESAQAAARCPRLRSGAASGFSGTRREHAAHDLATSLQPYDCPVCGHRITELVEHELADLDEVAAEVERALQAVTAARGRLDEARQTLTRYEQALVERREQLDRVEASLRDAPSPEQLEELQARVATAEAAVEEAATAVRAASDQRKGAHARREKLRALERNAWDRLGDDVVVADSTRRAPTPTTSSVRGMRWPSGRRRSGRGPAPRPTRHRRRPRSRWRTDAGSWRSWLRPAPTTTSRPARSPPGRRPRPRRGPDGGRPGGGGAGAGRRPPPAARGAGRPRAGGVDVWPTAAVRRLPAVAAGRGGRGRWSPGARPARLRGAVGGSGTR
ncbi:MAG: hypothetical protein U5R31_05675 [Acidimicrobiia bacterium]|nr:hypothetical protein [Acidimicrobiia bacterium]